MKNKTMKKLKKFITKELKPRNRYEFSKDNFSKAGTVAGNSKQTEVPNEVLLEQSEISKYEAFYKATKAVTDFIKVYCGNDSGAMVVIKNGKASLYETVTQTVLPD